MGLSLVRKLVCSFILLVLVLPMITGLNAGVDFYETEEDFSSPEEQEAQVTSDKIPEPESQSFIPDGKISLEVAQILKRYSQYELEQALKDYLIRFNEKMLVRRERFTRENPGSPYIPLDITKMLGKVDPITGMMVSAFPGAELSKEVEMVRFGFDPRSSIDISSYLEHTIYQPLASTSTQTDENTRGSREVEEADLEVSMLEWTSVNGGWGNRYEVETVGDPPQPAPGDQFSYGGFQVGKTTTFTVTILKHTLGVTAKNVRVNFTIVDLDSGTPMQRNPTSKLVNITGLSTKVTHDFITPFAGTIYVSCLVDYLGDPDTSNNGIAWYNMPVFIWSADFESGSDNTDWGWQKKTDGTTLEKTESHWTGDPGPVNAWHITDEPENQDIDEHTKDHAWFHGEDQAGTDIYDDSVGTVGGDGRGHLYLATPHIDMGVLSNGQDVLGDLQEDYYYRDYSPKYSPLVTGELEEETYQVGGNTYTDYNESDVVWVNEVADNSAGDNWNKMGFPPRYITGDYSHLFDTPAPHWNPLYSVINGQTLEVGRPFDVFVGDGSGGTKDIGGAQNWSQVRFRLDFTGDSDADVTDKPGFYFDDFATWGIHEYIVDNRVGITKLKYPKTNDVSILYEDSTATFSVKVKNYGKSQQVSVKATIYEFVDNQIGDEVYSKISPTTLGNDQESLDIIFSWMPEKMGDYKLIVSAGDPAKDWTPADNRRELILHVSPDELEDVDILVVDDDDSVGQGGIFIVNTEFRMLEALKDNQIEYRVYTVEHNDTGSDNEVMSDYEMVIWMTGLDNEYTANSGKPGYSSYNKVWDVTLKGEDEDELEKYLDDGGRLWLISPGYFYDKSGINPSITGTDSFAYKYLKIDRSKANKSADGGSGTPNPLEGVDYSCMEGAEYITYDEPPAGFVDIGGWVMMDITDKISRYLFYQDEEHYNYNSLHYRGEDFVSVYFAFNFYMISGESDRQDCVYKLLACSGLLGGVQIQPYNNNEKQKTITPGQEIAFRLKITNTGEREDIMALSMTKSHSYSDWDAWLEINGVSKNTVTIAGLEDYTEAYLHVQMPAFEDPEAYEDTLNQAGNLVGFIIKAESQNTGLENSTKVHARIGVVSNITINCYKTAEELDVLETMEFPLEILNLTNGVDNVEVRLSIKGAGRSLAQFSVNGVLKSAGEIIINLEPNAENLDVKLIVTTGKHTLAGYHNVTVEVKDEENTPLDRVDIEVLVNQFYQVKCTTEGDIEDSKVNFIIDPNKFLNSGEEFIKKSFIIKVQNFGNGIDYIELGYEENEDSKDISYWEFEIISPDTEDDISTVSVAKYNEANNPEYGEKEVQFNVYIPIEIAGGIYIVDFVIESSQPETVNIGVDEEENNRVSFKFEIVKPNLRFTKFNDKDFADNFEFWDFNEGIKILKDYLRNEFYIEKSYNEFDQLIIEFVVHIDNVGESDVELDPSMILLNISHENEYGDIIYDIELAPQYPRSPILISPGENATFRFEWAPSDQRPGTTIDYIFKIIIDPGNEIIESEEDDNSDQITITIHYPKKHIDRDVKTNMGVLLTIILVIVIIALAVYLILFRRKKSPAED